MARRRSARPLALCSLLFGSCSAEPVANLAEAPILEPPPAAAAPSTPAALASATPTRVEAERPTAADVLAPSQVLDAEASAVLEPAAEATAPAEATPSEAPPVEHVPSEASPPLLFAAQREVFVYEAPSSNSRKLGYLRAGARVTRSAEPATTKDCTAGFYRIAPEGYVCAGVGAKLEPGDPVNELLSETPDRLAPMPFVYARARHSLPPFYTKLPNSAEQRIAEPELSGKYRSDRNFVSLPARAAPEWLSSGRQTPSPFGYARTPDYIISGRALPDSSFALLGVFEREARRFGLLSDLTFVPLDRVERVQPSTFHGLALDEAQLPVAFVLARNASLYAGNPKAGVSVVRALGYREAVPITGERLTIGGLRFVETADGNLLRDDRLLEVSARSEMPRWAQGNRRWIHVSIEKQALVAYEGARPVYVTLVSTGADGLGDPLTTRSTVRGQFLVHTKHVTSAMTSDEVGDEYAHPDVPWVQYFSDNYAFHAAYWHDAFGTPRSHGCINLSPRDARFLFNWTDPPVPQGWHGSFSLRSGTLVDITP